MKAFGTVVISVLLVQASRQVLGSHYGQEYEYYRKNGLNVSEEDLHLLHDAFHVNLHFPEQQANDLISQIQEKVSSAHSQSNQVGGLITDIQSLIQFVKETKDSISNPGNFLQNSLSKLWGRLLADTNPSGPSQVLASLEGKVAEVKANQSSINRSLESATKFLSALELVKGLFTNKQGAWDKVKGFFGFSAAHLENLALQPCNLRGRRRLSLYQQEARRERLFSVADKIKKALYYLNTTPEDRLNVHDLESHLYDLIEEEGTFGRVYLRYIDTLKCILLKQCPTGTGVPVVVQTQNGAAGATTQVVEGAENPTLQEVLEQQKVNAEGGQLSPPSGVANVESGENAEGQENLGNEGENLTTVVTSDISQEQSQPTEETTTQTEEVPPAAVEQTPATEEETTTQTEELPPAATEQTTTAEEELPPVTAEEAQAMEQEISQQDVQAAEGEVQPQAQTANEGEPTGQAQPTNEEVEQALTEINQEEQQSAAEDLSTQETENAPSETQPATEQPEETEATATETAQPVSSQVAQEEEVPEQTQPSASSQIYPASGSNGETIITAEEISSAHPVQYIGSQQTINAQTGEVQAPIDITEQQNSSAYNQGSSDLMVVNESKDYILPEISNIVEPISTDGTYYA